MPITAITSATSFAGYAPSNLLIDAPVAWRSSHASAHVLTLRMAPEPIDTIALLQSNIPEDATVLVEAGTTTAYSGYSSGALTFRASPNVPGRPGQHHGLLRLPAAQSFEYWRMRSPPPARPTRCTSSTSSWGSTARPKTCRRTKSETGVDLGSLERLRSLAIG